MTTDNDVEGTMSVRQFGRAMLASLAVGGAVGGFVGYATGARTSANALHASFKQGVKTEETNLALQMTSDQPCAKAFDICYTEIQQGTINAAMDQKDAKP